MGELDKSGDKFRLLYDVKGRFVLHRIDSEEASFKLCRIQKTHITAGKVPVVVTHDGWFSIITVKDSRGVTFATRLQNAFVIGASNQTLLVTLPKGKGIKKTILEERADAEKRGEL